MAVIINNKQTKIWKRTTTRAIPGQSSGSHLSTRDNAKTELWLTGENERSSYSLKNLGDSGVWVGRLEMVNSKPGSRTPLSFMLLNTAANLSCSPWGPALHSAVSCQSHWLTEKRAPQGQPVFVSLNGSEVTLPQGQHSHP